MKATHIILSAAAIVLSACTQNENLAHFRTAWQSSSYDYDHTVQLVTDGLVETQSPKPVLQIADGEPFKIQDRTWMHDWAEWTTASVHKGVWDYTIDFREDTLRTDCIRLKLTAEEKAAKKTSSYDYSVMVSHDAQNWETVYSEKGKGWPELREYYGDFTKEIKLPSGFKGRAFRLILNVPDVKHWRIGDFEFMKDGVRLDALAHPAFNSSWMTATGKDEWMVLDLGSKCRVSQMVFHWLNRPVSGRVLVSDDKENWNAAAEFGDADKVKVGRRARYVKVEMDATADGEPFVLTEVEVLGRGNTKAGRVDSDWKVARLSEAGNPDAWLPAPVPGTVLTAYIDNGAVPDIMYADWNHCVSQSYFRSDFIYKGTMQAPRKKGEKVWLEFDGICWKADVSLNGKELGRISGAFKHERFDVTDIVRSGSNDVEVIIRHCPNSDLGRGNTLERNSYNGGMLGRDNPSFHATIGWDWIPSLAGRNIGIWNDVRFTTTGPVTISEPYVSTVLNLPDTTLAVVTAEALLTNNTQAEQGVRWTYSICGKDAESSTTLAAGETRKVTARYVIKDPQLWWPNGYGKPVLHDAVVKVSVGDVLSDCKEFKAGLRQMTYDVSDGRLTGWVNGRRFVGKGGNWGFSEVNLRYRQREYDIAVKYHAEQNFTMIRNWVGQTGDEEFYDACDKYGIMVWQDFWLANPYDGPDPDDEQMFMDNASDMVGRIRRHPSIALFCGRNEGNPPETLDMALRKLVCEKTPDLYYISHSSRGLVSGEGNYWRQSAEEYFTAKGIDRIHSERGMPNVPNYSSFDKFIPKEDQWPMGQMWAEHDWTRTSAQRAITFTNTVEKMFGQAPDAKTFCEWAQWVNYDGYRAMFEGRSAQRRGLLLWMSHPAWPSFVWSTYDYYFDPTASFYGAKKACEPLHIQWNPVSRKVELVNVSGGNRTGLVARAVVLDMYGRQLAEEAGVFDSAEDSTVDCFGLDVPEGERVYFYRLILAGAEGVISENTYVLGAETDNFQALRELPAANVTVSTKKVGDGYMVTLENTSNVPAMMIHMEAVDRKGERILPVEFSDNYFHLMPGEKKTCSSSEPQVRITGFNL